MKNDHSQLHSHANLTDIDIREYHLEQAPAVGMFQIKNRWDIQNLPNMFNITDDINPIDFSLK